MSGEALDQIAPRLAVASIATTDSGMLGMYEATRSPSPTPRRARKAASAPTPAARADQVISARGRVSEAKTMADLSPHPGREEWASECSA